MRLLFLQLCLLYFPLVMLASRGWSQEIPRQAWDNIPKYPAVGLSPLYEAAGEDCLEVLATGQRWQMLPRSVRRVAVRPDQPPVFEIDNGDPYDSNIPANQAAVFHAAQQTWNDRFRLLYDAKLLCRHQEELWIGGTGFTSELKHFDGQHWTTYRPFEGRNFQLPPNDFAWAAAGMWWLATSSGVYMAEEGTLKRADIPGWPAGGAAGIVGDGQGRAVAWSQEPLEGGTMVAFWNQGQWTTKIVPQIDRWLSAGVRPDASVVLASRAQVALVDFGEATEPDALQKNEPEVQQHAQAGHFRVKEEWFQPRGMATMSPGGDALFLASRLSDSATGVVRSLANGTSDFVPMSQSERLQIVAGPQGQFLILNDSELCELAPGAAELKRIATSPELHSSDRLVGCDRDGRVYLQRGQAFLVLLSQVQSQPMQAATTEYSFAAARYQRTDAGVQAAVDSKGTLWYIDQDSRVMKKPAGEAETILADDRLIDAASLWPGNADAMLVGCNDDKMILVEGDGQLITAASLVELAETAFVAMRSAAPRTTRDLRTDLRAVDQFRNNLQRATIWLTTGERLWINDGRQVVQFTSTDGAIRKQVMCTGSYELAGPLGDGAMLLIPVERGQIGKLSTWLSVAQADSDEMPKPVQPPPRRRPDGGLLMRPEDCGGPWYLDAEGAFWIQQGFDRVYRIDSLASWPMIDHLGMPRFEHPTGYVWMYHSARVLPGYEIGGPRKFRRSCRPCYRQHLTPMALCEDTVLCLTPLGLARLQINLENPDDDAVLESRLVAWGGSPSRFVGIGGDQLYLVVEDSGASHIMSLDLNPAKRPEFNANPPTVTSP